MLGTLAPESGVGSDSFVPLIEIWKALKTAPEILKKWYAERWEFIAAGDKVERYEKIKASYNKHPNGADLVFLCRACYGGVVRFRQADGYMSTPCGIHKPMPPDNFAVRVNDWHERVAGTIFKVAQYQETMSQARPGDIVYCDPPYSHSQAILYGAQSFDLDELMSIIGACKKRNVYVALSIDGKKKSGNLLCHIKMPKGLFEREVFIDIGRSMLKRFQMNGKTLEKEIVADRLLLTF